MGFNTFLPPGFKIEVSCVQTLLDMSQYVHVGYSVPELSCTAYVVRESFILS